VNLLPVPVLDGGHLLFYGVEAVRGRPLSARAQEIGFQAGFAVLISLFLFATWNDVQRLLGS
jgi:regulator of sigma E protease